MVAFNRVVLSGQLGGGTESWSTSCAFSTGEEAPVSAPSQLAAWATAIDAYLDSSLTLLELKAGLSTGGNINLIKVYFYASTGSPASAVGEAVGSFTGTGGVSRPFTTSACLSLSTGLAGRSFRGRMYWPALTNTISTTGRFNSTATQAFATQGAQLIEELADAAPTAVPVFPVVVSKTLDIVTPVTAVRVGDVPDTMRSRRDALVESYSTAAI